MLSLRLLSLSLSTGIFSALIHDIGKGGNCLRLGFSEENKT